MARTTASLDHDHALAEAERVGRLFKHILATHKGDNDAKETTVALLLEHLHWQRQEGQRDAAGLLRQIADGGERKGARLVAQALRQGADAIDSLLRKNAKTHRTFGEDDKATA